MQRCISCMNMYDEEYKVCPHCGYHNEQIEEAIHIVPGRQLHERYVIGRALGYGDFGITYVAWDEKLEQKVVIKEYMPSEFSTRAAGSNELTIFSGVKEEQFLEGMAKFIEEARKLAKFQSEDGIVKVFDVFEENKTAYRVMEFLDGETLSEYLKEAGTIEEDMAVEMMLPVMDSLTRVHEDGIIHRDIAPENIFITKTGQMKLIDFGASRYATTTHSRSLTVVVKQGYSPEEQYRSRGDQGPHTDVYSLAATMYKMITGVVPPDAMERRVKYETKNRDLLIPPQRINKKISLNRSIALLNALNVRIEDRTPDIPTFINELMSVKPVKRIYGKLKKIDVYTWPLWLKIIIPAAVAVILLFVGLMATGVLHFEKFQYEKEVEVPEGWVQVPDVFGMDREAAIKTLKECGLIVWESDATKTEYVTPGLIVIQDPPAGMFLEIGKGEIHLSAAAPKDEAVWDGLSEEKPVPYCVDEYLETALAKIEENGFAVENIEIVYEESETKEAGRVISQTPEYNTYLQEGENISLVVSSGPSVKIMPLLVNQSFQTAAEELRQLEISVNQILVNSDTIPAGVVVSQSVAEGESIEKGSSVTLEVSAGPKEMLYTVPNVVGLSRQEADALLRNAGFTVSEVHNYDVNVEAGKVYGQSQIAGTQLRKGTTVVITVSDGKQPGTSYPKDLGVTFEECINGLGTNPFFIENLLRNAGVNLEDSTYMDPATGGYQYDFELKQDGIYLYNPKENRYQMVGKFR